MEEKHHFNPGWIFIITLALVLLLLPRYLKKDSEVINEANAITQSSPSVSQTPPVASSTSNIITLEAGSFYYKPDIIRVKKGEVVKIELKSVSMMHDFNIDELNIHVPITKSGDVAVFEFTADQAGEFEYYCSVGKHRQLGQVGKLIVTE